MSAEDHPPYSREFCEPQYNQGLNVPDKAALLARRSEISKRVRERIPSVLDMPYGPGEKERLDIYPGPAGSPVAIFIHGGYWQRYDKSEVAFLAEPVTRAGMTLVAINYELCPATTLEKIVIQVRAACAWVYRNVAERRRVLVFGNSAGGHLTAMMMATDWRELDASLPQDVIKGGLAISGLYDLEPLLHTTINDALALDPAQARKLGPIHGKRATGAPLHLAVGELESTEFHRQTQLLVERWAVPSTVIPKRNHFDMLLEFAEPRSVMMGLLRELAR